MRYPKSLPLYLILAGLSALLLFSSVMLRPRFLYQSGINQLKMGNYEIAIDKLERAQHAIPQLFGGGLVKADEFRIYSSQGQALYHLGLKQWQEEIAVTVVVDTFSTAKSMLKQAESIDPDTYINTYYLARTEDGLEKIYAWRHPDRKNPYLADPVYQKAMALRPAGITVRHAYAQYLYDKRQLERIPGLVKSMVRIQPASYYNLRKAGFFGPHLLPDVEKGLNMALEQKRLRRAALKAMADLSESKGNLDQAIATYREYIASAPAINTAYDYIRLGQLILQSQTSDESFEIFKKALDAASDIEHTTNRIYWVFKKEERLPEFLRFSLFLTENNLGSADLDLCVARCWIAMDRPQMAKARLIQLTTRHSDARAYSLLASIAQGEKDWDQMERWAHQATRLDRQNAHYYLLLSVSLSKQKKYAHAEEVATQAIACAEKENAGYYNHRAWTRWSLKKYDQAAKDWHKAFAIVPDNARYPYYVAMASERDGKIDQARAFIEKALAIDPKNPDYLRLKRKLDAYR